MRWQVTYSFQNPLKFTTPAPQGYPAFGVTFALDAHGGVGALTHEFDVAPEFSPAETIRESESNLRLVIAALNYSSCSPLVIAQRSAQRVVPAGAPNEPSHNEKWAVASAVVSEPLPVPSAAKLAVAPARLSAWLERAAAGRYDEDPARALQYYDGILEERQGRNRSERVRCARNFVSHGGPMTDSNVKKFLEEEFGRPVDTYDSGDPEHRRLVAKWRREAHDLVAAELANLTWP
jgi:hypothetical protein